MNVFDCVLKCGKPCEAHDTISPSKWESLKLKSKIWNDLDKFGNVFNEIDWSKGNTGFYMHKSCYISI